MRKTRETGVGSRGAETELPPNAKAPTPDNVNWPLLYTAVLGELVILVLIFYAFTKAFA
jgi:hypothetical protein